jgi:hypothetical protein
MLLGMNVVGTIDGNALARYCLTHQLWIESDSVHERVKLAGVLAKLEAEFGLTPSARARLTIAPPKETKSGKSRFFAS